MTPKKMATQKKLPMPGHYRPPTVRMPGLSTYNAPTRGRVAKQMPSPKKPTR